MGTLHDYMYTVLSVTVQDVESKVRAFETKGNHVNLTAFSY